MSTVVTAEAPYLLRCAHCGEAMRTPPPGLRADLVVMAMLNFTYRHEQDDGRPKAQIYDDLARGRPHTARTGP